MEIALHHIHKRFGPVHANNDVNLTFHGGRIVGILGENGAGKSTLMKILSGYQPADSGEIHIDGRHVVYHGTQEASIPLSLKHGLIVGGLAVRKSRAESFFSAVRPTDSRSPRDVLQLPRRDLFDQ